jgi:UDP-N-acetyl-D-galactosamine dehydrogenase
VRNTRVVDVIGTLTYFGMDVTIYDPWADEKEVAHEYGLSITKHLPETSFDAILLAVAHKEFATIDFGKLKNNHGIIYDIKSFLPAEVVDFRL